MVSAPGGGHRRRWRAGPVHGVGSRIEAAAQTDEEVPGAPTNAQTRALDQTTIELTWDAPSNDAGGVPDGYRIDYSDDGDVWYALVESQTATKYVDNKELAASEARYYRIFAFNTAGTSRMLGPVEETTTASVAPDAPTALVVSHGVVDTNEDTADTHVDNEHLIVAWTAPVDPPGAPVMSYRIQWSKNGSSGSFNDLKVLEVKDAACSDRRCKYTDKDLFENTERFYRIYAMNSVDESPASEERSGKTAEGDVPAGSATRESRYYHRRRAEAVLGPAKYACHSRCQTQSSGRPHHRVLHRRRSGCTRRNHNRK